MTNLDRLERLSRLHSSGALTDAEYEREKARELEKASHKRRNVFISFVGLALLASVAYKVSREPNLVVTSASKMTARAPGPDQSVPDAAKQLVEAGQDVSAPKAERMATQPGTFAWATSTEIIGKNPEFLKSQLGPPETLNSNIWTYTIKGCSVSYQIDGQIVAALDTEVSARCRPTIFGEIVGPEDTFGKFANGSGFLAADCLYGCGNAYDPPIYLAMPGARANGGIDVLYSSVSYYGTAWEEAIMSKGGMTTDNITDYDAFVCVTNPPPRVTREIRSTKIDRVQVGYGVAERKNWCGRA